VLGPRFMQSFCGAQNRIPSYLTKGGAFGTDRTDKNMYLLLCYTVPIRYAVYIYLCQLMYYLVTILSVLSVLYVPIRGSYQCGEGVF
jgi:hypothetical protein